MKKMVMVGMVLVVVSCGLVYGNFVVDFRTEPSPVASGTTWGPSGDGGYRISYVADNNYAATIDSADGIWLNGARGSHTWATIKSVGRISTSDNFSYLVEGIKITMPGTQGPAGVAVGFWDGGAFPYVSPGSITGNAYRQGISVIFKGDGDVVIQRVNTDLTLSYWNKDNEDWSGGTVTTWTAGVNEIFDVKLESDGTNAIITLWKNGTQITTATSAWSAIANNGNGFRLIAGDPVNGDWGTNDQMKIQKISYVPEPVTIGLISCSILGLMRKNK